MYRQKKHGDDGANRASPPARLACSLPCAAESPPSPPSEPPARVRQPAVAHVAGRRRAELVHEREGCAADQLPPRRCSRQGAPPAPPLPVDANMAAPYATCSVSLCPSAVQLVMRSRKAAGSTVFAEWASASALRCSATESSYASLTAGTALSQRSRQPGCTLDPRCVRQGERANSLDLWFAASKADVFAQDPGSAARDAKTAAAALCCALRALTNVD